MADPIPAARLPYGGTWNGIVGVREVDPTTRTRYVGPLPTSTSVAEINSYLSSCPSGQYVELAAGTFNLNGDLRITTSGKTLRGAVNSNGLPATVLNFASGYNATIAASAWDFGSSGGYTTVNVSAGATRGSRTLTLSATPSGLSSGRLMWISAPKNAPTIDGGGWTDWFGTRPFTQCVKVTDVSGNSVSFSPAINADYLGSSVQVHYRSAGNQISFSGLENLSFVNSSGFFNGNVIDIQGADQCWVKNCKLYGMAAPSSLNAFIYLYCCYGCEIRRCDISHCASYGSSTYGLGSPHCSSLLIVDNYFHDLPNLWPILATSGSAFAYNYFTNEPYQSPTFLSQIVFFHGSHCHYNLFEGNWVPTHFNDATNDGNYSHSRNNLFVRQRMLGWDSAGPKSVNCHCITLQNHHDNVTVAACVMGRVGTQTVYYNSSGSVGDPNSIFNAEPTSNATLLRLGNYNTVNGGIPTAEVSALGGAAVASSYLYPSKPSWFKDRPWPWVDPANYSQASNAENFPAGYRAINGRDPASGSSVPAPVAPTNVRVIRS